MRKKNSTKEKGVKSERWMKNYINPREKDKIMKGKKKKRKREF